MFKGDNYDSAVGVLFLFTTLVTTSYVNTYGGHFRRNILLNPGINIIYLLFLFVIFWMCLSDPNTTNCIFRVNCDTNASLGAGDVPVIGPPLKLISVGGTGGCFL